MSVAMSALKEGTAFAPDWGPAKTYVAGWADQEKPSVPLDVTGDPDTLKPAGADRATLVTVPPLVASWVDTLVMRPYVSTVNVGQFVVLP